MVESDPSIVTSWMSGLEKSGWKLHFLFNKIKILCLALNVDFHHVYRSANDMVDALVKFGVDRNVIALIAQL